MENEQEWEMKKVRDWFLNTLLIRICHPNVKKTAILNRHICKVRITNPDQRVFSFQFIRTKLRH